MSALTPTGSPSFEAHPATGGTAIKALEDGSFVTTLAPLVNNAGDTSLTVSVIAKIMPNAQIGYLLQASAPNNFEILYNGSGQLLITVVGNGGATTKITTGAFDDGVERLYIAHFSTTAVDVSLHTGVYAPAEVMSLAPVTTNASNFLNWVTPSLVTVNTGSAGSFPLELNSTMVQLAAWHNQPVPTVSDCQNVLDGYLTPLNVTPTLVYNTVQQR